ncbi:MAG: hypothetical protein NTW78_09180 [Campylobacterales bacterium]|nr:hypothetical protein [Campylobacterales bacterium]
MLLPKKEILSSGVVVDLCTRASDMTNKSNGINDCVPERIKSKNKP